MDLKLTRKWLTKESTIGELTIDGKFECFVLEDNFPTPYVKTFGKTCIPLGRYEVKITYSPRFKVDMPLLLAVPGFEGVRIHPGNVATDTEGCLLPGRKIEENKVLESKLAYNSLLPKIKAAQDKGEPVHIIIEVEATI